MLPDQESPVLFMLLQTAVLKNPLDTVTYFTRVIQNVINYWNEITNRLPF